MFEKIDYGDLNSRQKENYKFQKIAGELADYGYNCLRLNDDWQGADFLAVHVDGRTSLKVQVKGLFTLDMKYVGKEIYIAFWSGADCYVYPHDTIKDAILARGEISKTKSWSEKGIYTWPSLPRWALDLLVPYRI
ncbi:MAG: hypothetical protein AAF526_07735 [Pseudomonadota bacterium]